MSQLVDPVTKDTCTPSAVDRYFPRICLCSGFMLVDVSYTFFDKELCLGQSCQFLNSLTVNVPLT